MDRQPPYSSRPSDQQRAAWARPVERDADYLSYSTMAESHGISLGDIYYILFRHKWSILLCSAAGFIAAGALYLFQPPPFQSEAKLFIRYVVTDNKAPGPGGDDTRIKSPDQRGETIMDSETEILTSLDLAKQVAEAIGPEKILARLGGGKDPNFAAAVVKKGLTVDVPPRSSVIRIVFQHPDPEVVQPVLRAVIDQYLKMHGEIHLAVGIIGDVLTQEADQLRARLAQTEEELRKARTKAGIISLDDSKKAFADQITRIRQEIFSAQAELAERSSIFEQLTKRSPAAASPAGSEQAVPPDKTDEYRRIVSRLEQLRRRELELSGQFTEENLRVKGVRAQMVEAEAAKTKLESEFPSLARITVVPVGAAATGAQPATIDLTAEAARLIALQSKIKTLNAQFDQVRTEAASVDQAEGSIQELRRKKDLEESNYRYYAASLEQARINEALGTGKVSNITPIQAPSPPVADRAKEFKLMAGVIFGGILLGLSWAFLIEMFFDRTVRRAVDFERTLGLPLFLSIPALGSQGKKRLAAAQKSALSVQPSQDSGAGAAFGDASAMSGSRLPAKLGDNLLTTFHETLRDRLIGYFESRDLTHKPKLVAVTGLGRSAGVTTTAAGLASSLSQTGEGNVLLVDMTAGQGAAQQFYRGKEVCGLDEILTTRGSAQIEENLYVVAEEPSGDKLSRILPQRFTKLVPKLKASNFDYIIFDMPPVSQISITPRLAGFMDMVLLVIESEKTDRDLVQRAIALLGESKAHVGAVLNKTRNYLPARFNQDV